MNFSSTDDQPTRALILSAGQGRRLLPFTADRPKCLLELDGRTVIERQIDGLRTAGIRHITVVLGYGASRVEQLLRRRYGAGNIETLFNPFSGVADNLASCWIARPAIHDDFVLLNGDTLFDQPVLQVLLAAPPRPITLAIDRKPAYDADDMKVSLDGDRLARVGKTLPLASVDGESIGMIRFRRQGSSLFREALERIIRTPEALQRWYLSVIDELARTTGQVFVQSVENLGWAELDVPQDLEAARRLVLDWEARTAVSHG